MVESGDFIDYGGYRYRRYPDAEQWSDRVYYRRGGGLGYLHRAIWEDTHGRAVPDGHEVHHQDGNPLNNDPSNLVIIPAPEHRRAHPISEERLGNLRAHIDSIRPLAAEWHRSEEGREWHRRHGRAAWEGRAARTYTCAHCDEEFESLGFIDGKRYCSNRCAAAARRASGVDDEDRTCEGCGGAFRVNRYERTRTCSRQCGQRLRRAARGAGVEPDGA